jgi:sigma-B regulation protein RsbU (phosphoserine phosphatase)
VTRLGPTERAASEGIEGRLDGLRAVTDVALAYLDTDDLLNELLDRVLEALRADTAAVLLVDESETDLVARAARGIEEEVRQGVRVPIGSGFAGRVAAERRPIVLNKIDESTVWNPILWHAGLRAVLGVPLIIGTTLIGVLHVGTLGDRIFTADDSRLLQVAADRIAHAIRLRLLESERDAAEALQRSLLPSTPARIGELEFAARYVPAEQGGIGGDWYDVFAVRDTVWVVTGDVAGPGTDPQRAPRLRVDRRQRRTRSRHDRSQGPALRDRRDGHRGRRHCDPTVRRDAHRLGRAPAADPRV